MLDQLDTNGMYDAIVRANDISRVLNGIKLNTEQKVSELL